MLHQQYGMDFELTFEEVLAAMKLDQAEIKRQNNLAKRNEK